jgi:hypothetical protein
MIPMSSEPRREFWEGPFFRHEGMIGTLCLACGDFCHGRFKLACAVEVPKQDDFLEVVALAEAEHAVACPGRLIFREAKISKYVERSRLDISFGKTDEPHIFVVSDNRAGGHYEALTTYEPCECSAKKIEAIHE